MASIPGKRRRAREMALQMLYQNDVGKTDLNQVFAAFDLASYLRPAPSAAGAPAKAMDPNSYERRRKNAEEAFEYARRLVTGTVERRDEIDGLIRQQADNWRLERMPIVDRNILRLAIFEILHERDIPRLVVVDEAIELAKKFGSEQSGRFVNGLLDGLLKRRAFGEKGS